MVAAQKFNMKQIYDVLIEESPKVSWRYLLHRNLARPRALFTTWMLCHGRLPTKDRLTKLGFIQDTVCSICQNDAETTAHLFFNCRRLKEIWQAILDWIEVTHTPQELTRELHWLLQSISKKGWKAKILKLAFSETIYSLWQLRNATVFDSSYKENTINSIVNSITYRGWKDKSIRKHLARLMM
ncbi:uncharacterized protein LOC131650774 [Vicia villosa]|uniref:uncharacterized protein LOC131650774 n=1 Tax=Vicia villosa TaxID=3911 RepID=UPI00273B8574|nr:uncharacterized protein LOC131650774 [Vicia villosa]